MADEQIYDWPTCPTSETVKWIRNGVAFNIVDMGHAGLAVVAGHGHYRYRVGDGCAFHGGWRRVSAPSPTDELDKLRAEGERRSVVKQACDYIPTEVFWIKNNYGHSSLTKELAAVFQELESQLAAESAAKAELEARVKAAEERNKHLKLIIHSIFRTLREWHRAGTSLPEGKSWRLWSITLEDVEFLEKWADDLVALIWPHYLTHAVLKTRSAPPPAAPQAAEEPRRAAFTENAR